MYHNQAAFPEELLQQDKENRVDYFSEGFLLDHPKFDQILNDVISRLFDFKKYPIIKITGPTGAGKSVVCKESLITCFNKSASSMKIGDLPAIYVEVPALGDVTKFPWKMMYKEILEALMHPPVDLLKQAKHSDQSKNSPNVFSLKSLSEDELRQRVIERIREMNVQVIILDEIQHMFVYTEANVKHNLDVLKSLTNISKCQFILVGTYEGIEKIHWNGQNSRRSTNLHFRHHDLSDSIKSKEIAAEEYNGFLTAYSGLLAHVPFHLSTELLAENNIDEAYVRCAGCIGILKEMIERAIDSMSITSTLTPSLLFEHSISSDDIETIWDEIKTGEAMLERTSFSDIRNRIGMKKRKPGKKTNKPVGVRDPKRDPIC
ncbi:TniB family NTP-binding protein [Reinekea sp. G2M2-21]|uniref:TniB family NTP-binding protein n=1 Tax=Reinekea sp. G2M2-21 TaxID=2788942 RepID=UPI0018ABFEF4|nr:TniB family NTP-binding protein [Reinekea sp. G2M2-21]